jgi:hypothetical protein
MSSILLSPSNMTILSIYQWTNPLMRSKSSWLMISGNDITDIPRSVLYSFPRPFLIQSGWWSRLIMTESLGLISLIWSVFSILIWSVWSWVFSVNNNFYYPVGRRNWIILPYCTDKGMACAGYHPWGLMGFEERGILVMPSWQVFGYYQIPKGA